MLAIKIIMKPSEWLKNLRNGFGAVLINHCVPIFRERKVIERRLARNTHGDFYYWITDAYQSAGLKYNPLKKLELGINLNGDLASFRGWQVEIRYLF